MTETASTLPVIGLSTYREETSWGVWSQRADLLHHEYADSVVAAGGVPVLLPPATADDRHADAVVGRLDGLVISGGADVDPARYGEEPHARTAGWRPDRDAWEAALLAAAERAALPVLGVCRGMQLMAAVGRGPARPAHPRHASATPGTVPSPGEFGTTHVSTQPGSRVAGLVGDDLDVPCHHHQSVARASRLRRSPRGPRTARSRRWSGPATASAWRSSGTPRRAPTWRSSAAWSTRPGSGCPPVVEGRLEHCPHGRRPGERKTDVLGAPYTVETIALRPDAEGAVEANLVRLRADRPARRAVLHVHGFCDYFFQTEYAAWWADRGVDFYALDLRKYGRSIREHHTPGYVDDIREYFEELDEAWERITVRDGHDEVILSAHSTGGLTVPLWANERQHPLAGTILNSPWVDMHGPLLGADRRPRGPAARLLPAPARDPPQPQRRLRPGPAPRLRGRVGLRPHLEAAGVLAHLCRLAARGPARPCRPAPRSRRPRARCWCSPPGRPAGRRSCPRRCGAPTSSWTSRRCAAGPPRSAST